MQNQKLRHRKLYLRIILIIILGACLMIIPLKQTVDSTGFVLYNQDSTACFFIPKVDTSFKICDEIKENVTLEGIQFKRAILNSNKNFTPMCRFLDGNANQRHNGNMQNYYVVKCFAKYSYNESICQSIISKFNQEDYFFEVNNKSFIKLKYEKRFDLKNLSIKEIK